MAHYNTAARVSRDTIFIVFMLVFTFGRVMHAKHTWRNTRNVSRVPELVATIFLVLTTIFSIPIVGITFDDIEKNTHFKTPEEVAEYNAKTSTNIMTYLLYLFSSLCVWCLKGTYLSVFFSFAGNLRPSTRRFLYITVLLAVGGFIGTIITFVAWCRPITENWNPVFGMDGSLQTCMLAVDYRGQGVLSGLNIAIDLLIAILSVFIIRSIHLREKAEHIAMIVIFAIGFLSIAAAFARWGVLYYVWSDPTELASRVTISNLVLIEHFMRIEVLFGTAAYGLPVARKLLKTLVAQVRLLTDSLGWSSRSSLERSRNREQTESQSSLQKSTNVYESTYEMHEGRSGTRKVGV